MDDPRQYNIFQQLYCLSLAANLGAKIQGPEEAIQAALKSILNLVLPQLAGNWTLSWGPRVFKENHEDPPPEGKDGPDNVWFAAVDDTQKICVVAIAGTAATSLEDPIENLDVIEVVDFNAWVKLWSSEGIPKPETHKIGHGDGSTLSYCAKGTCIGVWNVLSNASTEPGEGTRIDQYLSGLDPSYTIVVTGHSLGGALSPTIALGLVKANLVGNHQVKALPSAGVSPGNEVFAADFATTFPKDPPQSEDYQVYNTDYNNVFDIVPQAWSIDSNDDRNLHNILDKIIHATGDLLTDVEKYVNGAIELSTLSHIRYTPLPGQSFAGPPPPPAISSSDELSDVLHFQHVQAYVDEIGVTKFMKIFGGKLSEQPGVQGATS